jgi:hypothetical protein
MHTWPASFLSAASSASRLIWRRDSHLVCCRILVLQPVRISRIWLSPWENAKVENNSTGSKAFNFALSGQKQMRHERNSD